MHKQLLVILGQKHYYGEIASRANITSFMELALSTKAADKGEPLPKLTR